MTAVEWERRVHHPRKAIRQSDGSGAFGRNRRTWGMVDGRDSGRGRVRGDTWDLLWEPVRMAEMLQWAGRFVEED